MQSLKILALVLVLTACASAATSPAQFVPASTDTTTLRRTQQLQISYGGDSYEMIGVLETSLDQTSLAVVSTNGLLLFSIAQTAIETKTTKHPDLPTYIDPIKILEDVQLVNWPREALLRAMHQDFRLDETPNSRTLLLDGVAFKSVQFQPDTKSWSHARLHDTLRNYTLDVRALSRKFIGGENT